MGYGGTKTEMERLVKDAAAMTQEQEDLNMTVDAGSMSFDNIVKAIQVVQKHQGIYGTTTKEALNTIEGSMNATKAAWQNLIAEFGKPDADIGARVADMITAVFGENGEGGLVRNVATTAGRIATTMVRAVGNGVKAGFDWLVNNGPRMVLDAVRGMIDALNSAASSIATFDLGSFLSGMDAEGIFERILNAGSDIGEIFREWEPDIQNAVTNLMNSIGTFVQTNGPIVLDKVGEVLGNIGNTILERGPELVGRASEAFFSLLEWVTSNGPALVDRVAEIVGNVINTARQWLIDNGPAILEAVGQLLGNIITSFAEHAPTILTNIATTIGEIIGYIGNAAVDMIPVGIEFIGGLITGTSQEGENLRIWFSELPGKLLAALGDVGSFLVDAGQQIIQGFWNGLTSKWDEVTGWVAGIGDWIAANKGPKQYDLGLLVPNGQWIMQSLQTGLEKGLPSVEDTIRDITDSIQTGINTNVSLSSAQTQSDVALMGMLGAIRDNMQMSVYLDGNTLVGGIAPRMNTAMGRL